MLRGFTQMVQRLRQAEEAAPPTPQPDAALPGPDAAVALAPMASLLDDFHEARLVDRRKPGQAGNAPIEPPSPAQVEALEDVLRAIDMLTAELGLEDAPKDIIITTRREFQILRFLDADPATYLFARLGRDGVALPEARLRVKDLERALGA